MQIETLREYIEFGKYLNFSTAAKKLFISQPALSNHIANLEKEVGIDLVLRNQELELTAAGKKFFEGSCEVVAAYDALFDEVRSLAKSDKQGSLTIRMAFNEGGGSVKLGELFGEYKLSHPAISMKLVKEGKTSIIDDIASGTVDCVQSFNFSQEYIQGSFPEVESIVIDRAPITIAAHKDHPLMTTPNLAFADIGEYPYAMPAGAPFLECHLSVRRIYEDNGLELKNVHYKIVDSLTDLIFTRVSGDEFLILGPNPSLPKHMAFQNFEPNIYQDFCLVYRKDNDNPVLESFVRYVKESLKKE